MVISMSHVFLELGGVQKADKKMSFRGHCLLFTDFFILYQLQVNTQPFVCHRFLLLAETLVIRNSTHCLIRQRGKNDGNFFKYFRVHSVQLSASASLELPPRSPETLIIACGPSFLSQDTEKTTSLDVFFFFASIPSYHNA